MAAMAGKDITRTHGLGTTRWGKDPLEVLAYAASVPLLYLLACLPIGLLYGVSDIAGVLFHVARLRRRVTAVMLVAGRRWRDRAERAAREASRG
jgi:hypothetical protein